MARPYSQDLRDRENEGRCRSLNPRIDTVETTPVRVNALLPIATVAKCSRFNQVIGDLTTNLLKHVAALTSKPAADYEGPAEFFWSRDAREGIVNSNTICAPRRRATTKRDGETEWCRSETPPPILGKPSAHLSASSKGVPKNVMRRRRSEPRRAKCNGTSPPDCESDSSSRDESRP